MFATASSGLSGVAPLQLVGLVTYLALILVGLSLMFGLIRVRKAFGFVWFLLLVLVFWPYLGSLIEGLPWWVLGVLGALFGIAILQRFVSIFLGRSAANSMAGALAAGLVRLVLALFVLPMRVVRRLFRELV